MTVKTTKWMPEVILNSIVGRRGPRGTERLSNEQRLSQLGKNFQPTQRKV